MEDTAQAFTAVANLKTRRYEGERSQKYKMQHAGLLSLWSGGTRDSNLTRYQIQHKSPETMSNKGRVDTILKHSVSVSMISRTKTMTYEGRDVIPKGARVVKRSTRCTSVVILKAIGS